MNLRDAAVAAAAFCGCIGTWAALPSGYAGKPFADTFHQSGVPTIPGIVQCALYDLGGEGVAYHDTDLLNNGSGKLNLDPRHQRAHAGEYIWHFRKDEGVDLSFVKDWADLNHTNLVSPHINQFYVGWTEDGEWCNYTVNVLQPGTYRIRALYAHQASSVTFDVNGKAPAKCRLPAATPGYHHWNFAAIGTIEFAEAGTQLLTFHYGKGNNFAYFDFELLSPGFAIQCDEAGTLTARSEGGRSILSIGGGRGIGNATVRPDVGVWPPAVVLRARLGGLESLTLACGEVELSASVASHGNHGRLLHLRQGNKDVQPFGTNSPYWIEIGTFDAAGQPVQGLPAAGGWFEARLPSALLKADQPLMVKWVDFYRQ